MSHLLTVNNCFQSEDFTNYWNLVEDLNNNQGWDDDTRLAELIHLFECNYTAEFAYEFITNNVFDDECESVYD